MSERPEHLPEMTPERLREIESLLRYESSISFQSGRAHESMWMLVAEVRRLREQRDGARAEVMAELLDARQRAEVAEAAVARMRQLFAGGPDTPCRTTWPNGIECAEIPMAELRRALDGDGGAS